ncbi:7441_t:CDS:2, partial [Gigaspora rosea]
LCANADGSHKLNPLIIGKYKRPRCFKNINVSNLAMTYRNSSKAWMIISLFHEWVLEFDCQVGLKYRGQRVLLLLDNCPSHDIGNITLRFTAVIFLSWMLQEVENGRCAEDLKMNMLQAIQILSADDDSDSSSLEDFCQTTDPINDIANALNSLGLPNPMNVEEYLAIPEENIVYEVPPDNQVIMELVETFRMDDPVDSDLEDADDSLEIPIVSANIANASLETVLMFLLQQDDTEKYINLVKKIEDFIKKTKVGHMRQSKIDQFL